MAAPIRALTAGALTAALALAFPAAAAAADPSEPTVSESGGKTTLKFSSILVDGSYTPRSGTATDSIPEGGPKAGDSFVFTDELRQGEASVGTATGKCVFEEASSAACDTVLKFPGGTISTVGTGDSTKAPVQYKVTSGTGKYAGVSGSGTLTQVDEKNFTTVLEYQGASMDGASPTAGASPDVASPTAGASTDVASPTAGASTDGASPDGASTDGTSSGGQVSRTPSGGAATGGGSGVGAESIALIGLGAAAAALGSTLFVRGRRPVRGD